MLELLGKIGVKFYYIMAHAFNFPFDLDLTSFKTELKSRKMLYACYDCGVTKMRRNRQK